MNARKSGYNYRHLLVVGTNQRSLDLVARLENSPELGYKLVGFVSENSEKEAQWKENLTTDHAVLGKVQDLLSILEDNQVDEVMVCLPLDTSFPDISQVSRYARDLGIVLRIIPDGTHASLLAKMQVEEFEGEYVITLFREKMLVQLLVKRFIDITVSALALIILSPVMFMAAFLVKRTSPGPILFKQKRVGMNQRRFEIYKFRSMVEDAETLKKSLLHINEQDGCAFKITNDPRVTKVGAILRKTSIDELPQLFNVLKGEMSLVGPRPSLPEEVKAYQWDFRRRLSVKPGITCFWQVSGRNKVNFANWMQMDKDYIDNWSLLLDLKILLKTIPAVLFQGGAS
jgi:exopolysaccharide biosynthesis polyprenyl glycosylphosphotransferase